MPVTAQNLTKGFDTSNTSFTTASISPGSNRLVLVSVFSRISGVPVVPTLTGNGLTYVQEETQTMINGRFTTFRALGASPTSGAITIDFDTESQSRCVWTVDEFDNVDTGGTNGSAAVVQSVPDTEVSNTSGLITLAAFADSGNATYGAFGIHANESLTQGTGFTELAEQAAANNSMHSEWRNDPDTSVDSSWTSSVQWAGIGIEIAVAVVGESLLKIVNEGMNIAGATSRQSIAIIGS